MGDRVLDVLRENGGELYKLAEDHAVDLALAGPTEYEIWFELVGGRLLGVIDMGTTFGAVFEWSYTENEWYLTTRGVYETISQILTTRRDFAKRGGETHAKAFYRSGKRQAGETAAAVHEGEHSGGS